MNRKFTTLFSAALILPVLVLAGRNLSAFDWDVRQAGSLLKRLWAPILVLVVIAAPFVIWAVSKLKTPKDR